MYYNKRSTTRDKDIFETHDQEINKLSNSRFMENSGARTPINDKVICGQFNKKIAGNIEEE